MSNKIASVINRRGKIVKTFAEILLELHLHEHQRIADATEREIVLANYIHLCAETSPTRLLGAVKNS